MQLYGARHYGELESRVRCLRVDYVKAAYLLTERLIQRGFERIAFSLPTSQRFISSAEKITAIVGTRMRCLLIIIRWMKPDQLLKMIVMMIS